jgi:hypothetical protein
MARDERLIMGWLLIDLFQPVELLADSSALLQPAPVNVVNHKGVRVELD